jgi:hypothetical protein
MTDWQPEKRLWQAVVNQAVEDYCNTVHMYRLERNEAHSFFHRRGEWRQSFKDVCDAAGYSPSSIRKRLRERYALMGNDMVPRNLTKRSH